MEKLKLKLEILNSKIEEIYMNLARRFPKLFKELILGFEESSKLISCFEGDMVDTEQQKSSGQVEDVITEAKSVIKAVIDETLHFFIDIVERDNALFVSIKQGIKDLTYLEAQINNIREDSIEMEVISLNSMIAALKAGKGGRGFFYIAEELKKLSSLTANFTQELTNQGEDTLQILNKFRKAMEGIQNFQQAFCSDFRQKLNSRFESYNQVVKKLADILLSVINEANSIKKPLYRIMEEVQLQDIIKQAVNHVIISLKEIKSDFEVDSNEDFLDEISFVEEIPDLCINLLDEVQAKITNSLTVLRENFSDIRQVLYKVEEKKAAFLDFVNIEESDGLEGSALKQMFSESAKVLEDLLGGINRSMQEKKRISQDGNLIIEHLKLLEVSFQNFSEIVDRFYPIKVFSRIEIAKQRILQDRMETVEEMTRLSTSIYNDMKGALRIIKETLTCTNPAISQYSKEVVNEISVVKQMGDQIKENYDRLIFSKKALSKVLQSFTVYSDHFLSLLNYFEGDMERFRELIEVINGIKEELRLIQADGENRKKEALNNMGLKEWKIKNEKMKNMIKRFNIFTHKEITDEIGDFEIEEGGEKERITLF